MEHNPQLYDKIQKLYEEYWEISSRFHKDSDYYPIVKQLDDILYENPDNEYALQLKVIIKRSYKHVSKEELKALCDHLYKINPNNKLAKVRRFNPSEHDMNYQSNSAARLTIIIVIFVLIALQFISLFYMYTK